MDPQWIPALPHELSFEVQRQRLGMLEMVRTDPERVAELCGDLLLLTRLQESALRGMAIRCADLDAQAHRQSLQPVEPVAVPFATA